MTRYCSAAVLLAASAIVLAGSVQAQNMPNLGGLMGQGGLPDVSSASTSNTAGVLSYCVKNNYLKNATATSTLSKLTGQSDVRSSSGFSAGQQGTLETGNGNTFSLDGLKDQAKSKLCDLILQHAQSLL